MLRFFYMIDSNGHRSEINWNIVCTILLTSSGYEKSVYGEETIGVGLARSLELSLFT